MGGRWSLTVTASTTDLLFALTVRDAIMYIFFTALVDESRLCIRSLSCLRSNLLLLCLLTALNPSLLRMFTAHDAVGAR